MSKINKPDSQFVKNQIERLTSLETSLKKVVDSSWADEEMVRFAAGEIIDSQVENALRHTEIEQINAQKAGIRVAKLRAAGINTMWDARQRRSRLSFIEGIGSQSVEKFIQISSYMEQAMRSKARIRLSLDNKDESSTLLVRAIYVCKNKADAVGYANKLYSKTHLRICDLINQAAPTTSGFRWTFSKRAKKEESLKAAHAIANLVSGEYSQRVDKVLRVVGRVEAASDEAVWDDFSKNPIAYYTVIENVTDLGIEKEEAYGLSDALAGKVKDTDVNTAGLTCVLRAYQLFAVKYILAQKRVLLGDEMGLGKTIEAIASMVALRNRGKSRFMVVCPASVLVNWCREIDRHSNLSSYKCHGESILASLQTWREDGGVLVTTYETIRKFNDGQDYFADMIVADEAHYAKNPDAQRTKALVRLVSNTEYALYMTGTPLENRVSEMCFLITCLNSEIGASLRKTRNLVFSSAFQDKIAGVYFRRKREDVLDELPDLIESEEWLLMTKDDYVHYVEAVGSKNFMAMRRVSWDVDNLEQSSKAQRLLEICDEARDEGRKILIFSFFKSTIYAIERMVAERCSGVITGSVSPSKRQEMIDQFERDDDGAVLIAQIQAGGTGLNIQSASVVVICEPQVKPSIENQAISRAYRMGQARNVLVYRLLCENSVDSHMMNRLYAKQSEFDFYADKSKSGEASLALSESGIQEIIALETKRLGLED